MTFIFGTKVDLDLGSAGIVGQGCRFKFTVKINHVLTSHFQVFIVFQMVQNQSIVVLGCKAKYSKKSHETQNHPSILLKERITNPCVCLLSAVVQRVYLTLAVDQAFNLMTFVLGTYISIYFSIVIDREAGKIMCLVASVGSSVSALRLTHELDFWHEGRP